MAVFLLFVFVFASHVIGGFNTKLPPPAYGNTISILSIDGGGIKGILPTVVLQNLENALQIFFIRLAKDNTAALVDYFDVITGTSTGGLIAAMLTAPHPNDPSRPILSPAEIINFYLDFGPSIFNQTTSSNWGEDTRGPKYDGKFLHAKAKELLQETHLHDTLTNVVIPTFDIKEVHPVIFSSFKVKKVPSLNAKLSDIGIGTSAAPTLLPAYGFWNGKRAFNLVDGAVVASNPALVAVSEVIQQLEEKNSNFISVKANEPTKIVLLSLGCGRTPLPFKIDAFLANLLTAKEWQKPLIFGLAGAAGDVNEYHLESVFPSLHLSDNYYLRIEEYNLDGTMTADNVTKESMDNLIKAGEDLLEQPVKVMNVTSFIPQEKPSEGTNAEALKRLAEILYNEKQLRLKTKSMEKMGRPFIEAVVSGMK